MRNLIVRALIVSAAVVVSAGVTGCEDEKKPAPAPAPSGSAAAMASDTAKPTPAPEPKKPMAEMQIATIDALIAAMNAHDAKKYATGYSKAAALKVAGMPDISGSDAISAEIQKVFSAFSDFKAVKGRVWQKGNVAVAEWMVSGTQSGEWMGVKASNRPVGVIGVSVDTFDDDGLVKEEHRYFDAASLMSQLDPKAPAGTFRPVEKTAPPTDVHVSKGTPDEQKNLQAMNSLYKIIDDHKTADAMATMTDDVSFIDYTQPGEMKGKKGISDWFGVLFKAFPDLKQPLGTQIAADDYVITEGVIVATHKGALGPIKPTNKPVNVHFIDVIQLKDGKLVKGATYMNAAEMLMQIGVIPAPGTAPAASGSTATPAGSAPAAGTAKPSTPAPTPKSQ